MRAPNKPNSKQNKKQRQRERKRERERQTDRERETETEREREKMYRKLDPTLHYPQNKVMDRRLTMNQ